MKFYEIGAARRFLKKVNAKMRIDQSQSLRGWRRVCRTRFPIFFGQTHQFIICPANADYMRAAANHSDYRAACGIPAPVSFWSEQRYNRYTHLSFGLDHPGLSRQWAALFDTNPVSPGGTAHVLTR
jgi:hypothetical protein